MNNRFKQRLKSGETLIGLWSSLTSPVAAEACAASGIDWILIDGEHAPNDLRSIFAQLQAIAGTPASSVVRPPSSEVWMIKQLLDIGAQTLLIPMVDTAEQAAAVVAATRYPPAGIRGVGSSLARVSGFGNEADYAKNASDQICVLVQVESLGGLENLDKILATDGVDGVFIGPADLAASMGYLGQTQHPAVVSAVESAILRISSSGKAAGVLSVNRELAHRYLKSGARFVAAGSDVSFLVQGTRDMVREFSG
jgi:4-hydroxy-2-oxoheptanedioate aldolase